MLKTTLYFLAALQSTDTSIQPDFARIEVEPPEIELNCGGSMTISRCDFRPGFAIRDLFTEFKAKKVSLEFANIATGRSSHDLRPGFLPESFAVSVNSFDPCKAFPNISGCMKTPGLAKIEFAPNDSDSSPKFASIFLDRPNFRTGITIVMSDNECGMRWCKQTSHI